MTDADDDQWVVQNYDEFVDQIGDLMLRNITDEAFKEFLVHNTKKPVLIWSLRNFKAMSTCLIQRILRWIQEKNT